MFRRAFWFTTGAAAGVWATTKVQRKLRALAPDALAVRAAETAVATGHRLKDFALDVRAGMAQRESELNEALGLNAPVEGPAHRQLPAPRQGAPGAPRATLGGPYDHAREQQDRTIPRDADRSAGRNGERGQERKEDL